MRINAVRTGASGATKIVADGGSSFLVDLDLLEELGLSPSALAPGAELDDQAAQTLALAAEAREAEARGLALLARAEQSELMLRKKLTERGFGEAAVRLALGRLAAAGYLDDERFARAYIVSRLSRRGGREGPATLEAALRGRGIDSGSAASAIGAVLGPEERRAALAQAATEALARAEGDRAAARSRLRFLGYRGSEISDYFETMDDGSGG